MCFCRGIYYYYICFKTLTNWNATFLCISKNLQWNIFSFFYRVNDLYLDSDHLEIYLKNIFMALEPIRFD